MRLRLPDRWSRSANNGTLTAYVRGCHAPKQRALRRFDSSFSLLHQNRQQGLLDVVVDLLHNPNEMEWQRLVKTHNVEAAPRM